MQQAFDVVVVGKGMMGVAAARHLALAGVKVALIGPDEPADWSNHSGVFASHYDNGRITRTIDASPDWALLARRSIERYGEIEARSGLRFYTEVGCLIIGPQDHQGLAAAAAAAGALGVTVERLTGADIEARFPELGLHAGEAGVFEQRDAGFINPRAFVAASLVCAMLAGVTVISQEVRAVNEAAGSVEVHAADGSVWRGAKALVATGAFALSEALTGAPLALSVLGRTVLFAQVGAQDRTRLGQLPSLIRSAETDAESYYLLPPIRYPDGMDYIKIGGDPTDRLLASEPDVRAWFRGTGSAEAADHLARHLRAILPGFSPISLHHAPCAVTKTAHGLPYIGFPRSERIAVLTGGNGAAAKSADEIGRLGAVMVMTGSLAGEGYAGSFAPVVEEGR